MCKKSGCNKEAICKMLDTDEPTLETLTNVATRFRLHNWLVFPENGVNGPYYKLYVRMVHLGNELKKEKADLGGLAGMSLLGAQRIIGTKDVEINDIIEAVIALYIATGAKPEWYAKPKYVGSPGSSELSEEDATEDEGESSEAEDVPEDADGPAEVSAPEDADESFVPKRPWVFPIDAGYSDESEAEPEIVPQIPEVIEGPMAIMERVGQAFLSECAGSLYLTLSDGRPLGKTLRIHPATLPALREAMKTTGQLTKVFSQGADGTMLELLNDGDGVSIDIGDVQARLSMVQMEALVKTMAGFKGASP